MISRGGANVVMASTAYGGSSQLTDVIEEHSTLFKKTKYHVQGANGMVQAIRIQLNALSTAPDQLFPTTVRFPVACALSATAISCLQNMATFVL